MLGHVVYCILLLLFQFRLMIGNTFLIFLSFSTSDCAAGLIGASASGLRGLAASLPRFSANFLSRCTTLSPRMKALASIFNLANLRQCNTPPFFRRIQAKSCKELFIAVMLLYCIFLIKDSALLVNTPIKARLIINPSLDRIQPLG